MSIARVKTSAFAARKGATLKCHRCQRDIAKGEVYRWWFKGFRSRFKHVRCMTCPAPRYSELESSNKADAYAAIETAEDALGALGTIDDVSDVEQILTDAGDSIQEVADQYREADESFGGGGSTVSGEMADELENAASELSSWSSSHGEFDAEDAGVSWCDEHEDDMIGEGDDQYADQAGLNDAREQCPACQDSVREAQQTWSDDVVEEARDALTGVSF